MKTKLKAIIVDDERLARQALKEILKSYSSIEVIDEANNVDNAVELIKKLNPDVIFLDIQMPGETGFDLFDKVEINSKVIFVTAYDEFALRAFEVNALDYLLKPVEPKRLMQAISKLEHKKAVNIKTKKCFEYEDKILISLNSRMKFLKISTIKSVTSCGDYTQVHIDSGLIQTVNISMNEWEEKLPEKDFCRIHRSSIINLNMIVKVEKWLNGSYHLFLTNNPSPLIISKRYAHIVRGKFSFS